MSGKSRQMGASLSVASLSLSRTLSAAAGNGGSTMDAMNKAVRQLVRSQRQPLQRWLLAQQLQLQ